MHLDGVLGQAQLVRYLLVQQAIGQAQQHAKLLRRQLRQARGQGRRRPRSVRPPWLEPAAAVQHRLYRQRHVLGRGRLRYEAGGAKLLGAPDHARVVIGRDHHHRHLRILAAHMQQGRETMRTRHAQVQQHQLYVRMLARGLAQRGGAGRLQRLERRKTLAQQPDDGRAEQRVVVGDQQGGLGHGPQSATAACHDPCTTIKLHGIELGLDGFLHRGLCHRRGALAAG